MKIADRCTCPYPDWLATDISVRLCRENEQPDLAHLFRDRQKTFVAGMKRSKPLYHRKNYRLILSLSWYKKATGIETGMTEDIVRQALGNGLVDVKFVS